MFSELIMYLLLKASDWFWIYHHLTYARWLNDLNHALYSSYPTQCSLIASSRKELHYQPSGLTVQSPQIPEVLCCMRVRYSAFHRMKSHLCPFFALSYVRRPVWWLSRTSAREGSFPLFFQICYPLAVRTHRNWVLLGFCSCFLVENYSLYHKTLCRDWLYDVLLFVAH